MSAEFALILHAHLPYVRPASEEILEERWLYEAVAESYVPLLWSLERLHADGVPFRLSISFSGALLSMLSDPGLMARCREHLHHTCQLAEREARRLADTPLGPSAAFHRDRFEALVAELDLRGGALVAAYRALPEVELFTAAGTHPFLPLLATDEGRAAHIDAAVFEFERLVGEKPKGMWLPECAYAPGLDHLLAAAEIDWFIVDEKMMAATQPPVLGAVARTPGGVVAFARDAEVSRQVWDNTTGYPGDPVYREFYRDVGFDSPLVEVAPWLVEGSVRSDTGLKYYRTTGKGLAKEPYDPAVAQAQALAHARHYARLLQKRRGLIVAPFDAELFGHWWFEGPLWIEAVFRELAKGPVTSVTPTDWLARHPDLPVARLPAGSWGMSGDFRVWVAPENDSMWLDLHEAELRMLDLAQQDGVPHERLNQAARELMLAQASDWPFICYFRTTVDYAQRRVSQHLARFHALANGEVGAQRFLPEDGVFSTIQAKRLFDRRRPVPADGPLRILMLSWEFPPHHVGGLGRHVYDLGSALVAAGHIVHVVTVADELMRPGVTHVAGMTVHRVARPKEDGNFLAWTYRLNQALVATAQLLPPFDVIHSHDWLVGQAGMALKARWGALLVATIHATEKGRNRVIRASIQQAIHDEEWHLTATADQVITVSQAMSLEVAASFRVRATVIYNGVAPPLQVGRAPELFDAPYFFYIGRLVQEKGVHVAIEALAHLKQRAHLVVAGKGPMEGELRDLARQCGVADRVHFVGRVSDAAKDGWLQHAAGGLVPSLYEPFGIVALEVMAAGAPVVVGDTGGLAEIVTHNVDGLKVYPGDVPSLTAALDWLLANPAAASGLARAGQGAVISRFSWSAIAAETVAVYRAGTLVSRVRVTSQSVLLPINVKNSKL